MGDMSYFVVPVRLGSAPDVTESICEPFPELSLKRFIECSLELELLGDDSSGSSVNAGGISGSLSSPPARVM